MKMKNLWTWIYMVWFYFSSHSSSQYMNMGWWKSSCHFTNVITHSENKDAVCCNSHSQFPNQTVKLESCQWHRQSVSNKLTAEQKAIWVFLPSLTTYSWMVHGVSTCGTSGQEKVCDTASTVALTGKNTMMLTLVTSAEKSSVLLSPYPHSKRNTFWHLYNYTLCMCTYCKLKQTWRDGISWVSCWGLGTNLTGEVQ